MWFFFFFPFVFEPNCVKYLEGGKRGSEKMSLQTDYFWMRSRAGEVALGGRWCDALEPGEAGGLWGAGVGSLVCF